MKMLIDYELPHEPFNTLVKNGTAGSKMKQILEDINPEAIYFTERNGKRGGTIIVDVAEPSKLPSIAEPFFLSFNADLHWRMVFEPEDLANAVFGTAIGQDYNGTVLPLVAGFAILSALALLAMRWAAPITLAVRSRPASMTSA